MLSPQLLVELLASVFDSFRVVLERINQTASLFRDKKALINKAFADRAAVTAATPVANAKGSCARAINESITRVAIVALCIVIMLRHTFCLCCSHRVIRFCFLIRLAGKRALPPPPPAAPPPPLVSFSAQGT